MPGDIVLVRNGGVVVWCDQPNNVNKTQRLKHAGVVDKKALGMIIALGDMGCTYVLWSNPIILGWVYDDELWKVKV